MLDEYVIQVNQYSSGATGHVNITYIGGGTSVTYGANLSPSSGVQIENGKVAGATYSVGIAVTKEQFQQSLVFSRAADLLNNSYYGVCNNCVDFVNEALKKAGIGDWSIDKYLKDGTLVDSYAKIAKYVCHSEYVNLEISSVLNVLSSASSVNDALNFVDALSWLTDHETGSDFYQNYYDPDAEADWELGRLYAYAKKLGISVKFDPIREKVVLGVASPIAIDLNGDGVRTTSYSVHSVNFDINGDGVKDRTAWLSGEDGFLAVDLDGNGQIDGVGELFGGVLRGDGYEKLSHFDSNHDGLIDVCDAGYKDLLIWQDANMNGVADAGEVKSLADVGVESISVVYKSQEIIQNNNLIGEVSRAIVNGSVSEVADVYFKFDSINEFEKLDMENIVELVANSPVDYIGGISV